MLRTILKPLSFVPALLIMYMIFAFSAQPASQSSQNSLRISVEIVKLADKIMHTEFNEAQIEQRAEQIHTLVRKTAHVLEYLLLAVFVALPLHVYGMHGFGMFLLACLICIGYAGSDEFHQSFIAGRSMELRDIAVDSIGILLGLIFARLFGMFKDNTDIVTKREQKRDKKRARNRRNRPERMADPVQPVQIMQPQQTGQIMQPVVQPSQSLSNSPVQKPLPQSHDAANGTQPYRPYRYGRQVPPVTYRQPISVQEPPQENDIDHPEK